MPGILTRNEVVFYYCDDSPLPYNYYYHYRYSIYKDTIAFYPRSVVREIDMPGFDNILKLSNEELNNPKNWPPTGWSNDPIELTIAKIIKLDDNDLTLQYLIEGNFLVHLCDRRIL